MSMGGNVKMKGRDKLKEMSVGNLFELERRLPDNNFCSYKLIDDKYLLGDDSIGFEQLQNILEIIPYGISITTDLSCRDIRHNSAAAKILRINPWESFSLSSAILPPVKIYSNGKRLLPENAPMQRSAIYGEIIADQEVEMIWEDGVRKITKWNSRPFYDSKGEIVGVVAFCEDISNLKTLNLLLQCDSTACNVCRKLVDIVEFLPDATFAVDINKRVIFWNRAIEDMTGINKKDIIGKSDFPYSLPFYGEKRPLLVDIIISDKKDDIKKYNYFERKKGILYAESFSKYAFNGKGAFWWGKASPLYDNEGNIVGAIESVRDMTEHKKIENELKKHRKHLENLVQERNKELIIANKQLQSEITERKQIEKKLEKDQERLYEQLLFSNSLNRIAETIIVQDDKKTILNDMTRMLGQTLGVDRCSIFEIDIKQNLAIKMCEWMNEEVVNMVPCQDIYSLDQYSNGVRFIWNCRKWLESHIDNKHAELTADGSAEIFHHQINIQSMLCYPFSFQQSGYYLMIFSQIRYRRTWHLDEFNFISATAKLVELATQKISILYERGQFLETLRKAEEEKELILSNLSELVVYHDINMRIKWANEAAGRFFGLAPERLVGHRCYELWKQVEPCDGCPVKELLESGQSQEKEVIGPDGKDWLVRANPVYDGNRNVIGTVQVALEISHRKQLEQEIARLDRLNLIGEMAAGIGHEIRNPMTTVRGFLQMMAEKNDCLKYKQYYDLMIEELDRANSIITEYLSLAKNKCVNLKIQSLNQILDVLYPLIQATAMREDKFIVLSLGDVPNLLLDEKEIRQLILNLSRNGLEAMSPGGKLIIKTMTCSGKVALVVQDEGSGIRPEIIKKLGTPFFTTKNNGTGLGLSVCYSIANRHKATLKVESNNMGTTFSVWFNQNQPEFPHL
ncbi:signal transduction histidine kinase, nitrogen specific, NtrB [Desulfofarcimen acetoxidans DSM 771]|uniref:histidine kinase n=1 Tax=Desulfofarcimen acetoxidans (strain ATCC 49208 / DSM 771 / KCTC 5769 / VKM B-1644 / 5575) TaxID=485916 RepID=C8VXE2_DESAS|nr:PAS domain-containing protein [Desulfofarcimen acetoxidans]ACV64538.1 signal transduction histidine kinase, nitrogen specific, NtrB [Desulfofarcimen acetoxidans DSM 771]